MSNGKTSEILSGDESARLLTNGDPPIVTGDGSVGMRSGDGSATVLFALLDEEGWKHISIGRYRFNSGDELSI